MAIYGRREANPIAAGFVARLLNRAMTRIPRGPRNDDIRPAPAAIEFAIVPGMYSPPAPAG